MKGLRGVPESRGWTCMARSTVSESRVPSVHTTASAGSFLKWGSYFPFQPHREKGRESNTCICCVPDTAVV